MISREATGESIFEVPTGEERFFYINHAICEYCGAVHNGKNAWAIATGEYRNDGPHGVARLFILVTQLCPCNSHMLVHNSKDGIPVKLAKVEVAEIEWPFGKDEWLTGADLEHHGFTVI
ncbi:MAG: hypothetical protein ACXADF_15030 [Candidatus Thorarchaeota archaeon]|jgi:hypothetical protein